MKKAGSVIWNVFVTAVAILAAVMMVYTIFTVTSNDEKDRAIFGYKMFIVVSDSMSATDFKAGDLIFVKEVLPDQLKVGDIIAFTSQNEMNYGETVAHKIRSLTLDTEGQPGFITYGTTTNVNDEAIVGHGDVIGRYAAHVPSVGGFFGFLKTVPGYLLFVLLPFMILIIIQGINCVRSFKEYRQEEISSIKKERERLEAEREEAERALKELERLRAQLADPATDDTEAADCCSEQEVDENNINDSEQGGFCEKEQVRL